MKDYPAEVRRLLGDSLAFLHDRGIAPTTDEVPEQLRPAIDICLAGSPPWVEWDPPPRQPDYPPGQGVRAVLYGSFEVLRGFMGAGLQIVEMPV